MMKRILAGVLLMAALGASGPALGIVTGYAPLDGSSLLFPSNIPWCAAVPLVDGVASAGALGTVSRGDHVHPVGYSKGVFVNSGASVVDTTAAAYTTGAGQILSTTAAGTAAFAAAPTTSNQVPLSSGANAWAWAAAPGGGSVPTGTGWRHVTGGVEDGAASTPTKTDVGLGSVTNDVQTKASVVPNTTPTAGQILVGNAGNTAYAPVSASGDVFITSTGAHTIQAGVVTLAKQANLAANSIQGNNTGSPTTPIALTVAQVQALIPASQIATSGTAVAISSTAPGGAGQAVVTTSTTAAQWTSIVAGNPGAAGQVPYASGVNTWSWTSPLYASNPLADSWTASVGNSLLASPGNHVHPAGRSMGLFINSGASVVDVGAASPLTGAGQILSSTSSSTAAFLSPPTTAGQTLRASGANAWTVAALTAGDVGAPNGTANTVVLNGSSSGSGTIAVAAVAGATTWRFPGVNCTTSQALNFSDASGTMSCFNPAQGSQIITFAGPTAARTVTLPDANITVARTDAANTFTGVQTMTSPALTTPAIGAATGTSLTVTGAILSSGGGHGYSTGAGGTVTQATSRTTGVTLNKLSGKITMFSSAIAADAVSTFTFTNSFIAATDLVLLVHNSATNGGAWQFSVVPAAGSASITVRNVSNASITEATPLLFVIIKAVQA